MPQDERAPTLRWVWARADEILKQATEEQRHVLMNDRNYGAPYSFWFDAQGYGLASKSEVDLARQIYGDLWNYRGD